MKGMTKTFFFYDLETSGLSPRDDRIMQFAGIRTDENLQPIGDSINELVALNDDTLPSPDALLVTGITPQQTVADGYTEAQFAQLLQETVFTPETTVVGFNNIRFDDEFIRHLLWRNFHDPYEWAWKDGRSRWDMLDVVRLTRALRPDGVNWPEVDGKEVNKLELLASANDITHENAHDALSDVEALISITKLIRDTNPQLFGYLLKMRDKKQVKQLVNLDEKKPFVYTSGRYDANFHKTTVAFPLSAGRNGNVLVYDLRYDPAQFINLSADEIKKRLFASWKERQSDDFVAIPVKELQYNRAPAVAPLGVLEQADGWNRLQLSAEAIEKHAKTLLSAPHFAEIMRTIVEVRPEFAPSPDPEAQLYDGFVSDRDKLRAETVRNADERSLSDFHPDFTDERLQPLLLHYKARGYPRTLSSDEAAQWEAWREDRLSRQLPEFVKSLERRARTAESENDQFVLQELRLWLENITPVDTSDSSEPD